MCSNYGWALKKPRGADCQRSHRFEEASRIVEGKRAKRGWKGTLAIDYVGAGLLRACGRRNAWAAGAGSSSNISPSGKISALPCRRRPLPGSNSCRCAGDHSIAWIWQHSEAFNRYRRARAGWPSRAKSCEFQGDRLRRLPAARRLPFQVMAGQYRSGLHACRRCTIADFQASRDRSCGRRQPLHLSQFFARGARPGDRRPTMAPDARRGEKSFKRPIRTPFCAPLTFASLLPVGPDGHEILRRDRSAGRMASPRSICTVGPWQRLSGPDHRPAVSIRSGSTRVFLRSARARAEAAPKGRREE